MEVHFSLRTWLLVLTLGMSLEILHTHAAKGVVNLDSLTFDKVLNAHKYVFVKFDKSYAYGPKEDAFVEFANLAANEGDLLVCAVAVSPTGNKDNEDLSDRFAIKPEDFPSYKLFSHGQLSTVHAFDGDVTAEALVMFVRDNSILHIPLAGCLEVFDRIAARVNQVSNGNVMSLKSEAMHMRDELSDDGMKATADIYIKILQLTANRGQHYPSNEVNRVQKLLKGKVSAEKVKELQQRLNILHSFLPTKTAGDGDTKEEL